MLRFDCFPLAKQLCCPCCRYVLHISFTRGELDNFLRRKLLLVIYNYSIKFINNYIAFELGLNNIDIILHKILDDNINLLS